MAAEQVQASGGAQAATTQLGDLPEACLAQAIALTSPRDACRCAAVSPAFRAAADSDHVWRAFLPPQLDRKPTVVLQPAPPAARSKSKSKKEAYLGLCDAAGAAALEGEDGGCRVWLERATGARCYALSARRLSLPWDDGEFCWKFAPHPRSRSTTLSSSCSFLHPPLLCYKSPLASLTINRFPCTRTSATELLINKPFAQNFHFFLLFFLR
jgi:hypothetical protein